MSGGAYGFGVLPSGLTIPSASLLSVAGGTLTLQPDASAGIDTHVRENASSSNFATGTFLRCQGDADNRKFGFMKFDLSSISGKTVTSATLTLWNTASNGVNRNFQVNSILSANSDWTEAGATWDEPTGSAFWEGDVGSDAGADAGCSVSSTDWNATDLGTFTYTANDGANTAHVITLVNSQIQSMVDGSNYGILLKYVSTDSQNFDFQSSDYATAANRPKLVIEYT